MSLCRMHSIRFDELSPDGSGQSFPSSDALELAWTSAVEDPMEDFDCNDHRSLSDNNSIHESEPPPDLKRDSLQDVSLDRSESDFYDLEYVSGDVSSDSVTSTRGGVLSLKDLDAERKAGGSGLTKTLASGGSGDESNAPNQEHQPPLFIVRRIARRALSIGGGLSSHSYGARPSLEEDRIAPPPPAEDDETLPKVTRSLSMGMGCVPSCSPGIEHNDAAINDHHENPVPWTTGTLSSMGLPTTRQSEVPPKPPPPLKDRAQIVVPFRSTTRRHDEPTGPSQQQANAPPSASFRVTPSNNRRSPASHIASETEGSNAFAHMAGDGDEEAAAANGRVAPKRRSSTGNLRVTSMGMGGAPSCSSAIDNEKEPNAADGAARREHLVPRITRALSMGMGPQRPGIHAILQPVASSPRQRHDEPPRESRESCGSTVNHPQTPAPLPPPSFRVPRFARRASVSHVSSVGGDTTSNSQAVTSKRRMPRRGSTGALLSTSRSSFQSFSPHGGDDVDLSEGDVIEAFADLHLGEAASFQNPLQIDAEYGNATSASDSSVEDPNAVIQTGGCWPHCSSESTHENTDMLPPRQAPTLFMQDVITDLHENEAWMKADEELIRQVHGKTRSAITRLKMMGMESPYRSVEEVIPSFSALHACVSKNLHRNRAAVAQQAQTADVGRTTEEPTSRCTSSSLVSSATSSSSERDDLVDMDSSRETAERSLGSRAEIDTCSSYIVSFEFLRMVKKFEKIEPVPESSCSSDPEEPPNDDLKSTYDLVENDELSVLANYLYCGESGTDTAVLPTSLCSVSGIRSVGGDGDSISISSEKTDTEASFSLRSLSSLGLLTPHSVHSYGRRRSVGGSSENGLAPSVQHGITEAPSNINRSGRMLAKRRSTMEL